MIDINLSILKKKRRWGQALEFVCATLYRHKCCIVVTYDSFIVQSVCWTHFFKDIFFYINQTFFCITIRNNKRSRF